MIKGIHPNKIKAHRFHGANRQSFAIENVV